MQAGLYIKCPLLFDFKHNKFMWICPKLLQMLRSDDHGGASMSVTFVQRKRQIGARNEDSGDCFSVRMFHLPNYETNFHKIWYYKYQLNA
jgi:hypothetical protein